MAETRFKIEEDTIQEHYYNNKHLWDMYSEMVLLPDFELFEQWRKEREKNEYFKTIEFRIQ